MFKTLITTCLLIFSSASGGLKEVPQKKDLNVRNLSNSYRLYGGYCLNDTFDNLEWGDTSFSTTLLDFTNEEVINVGIFYDDNNTYNSTHWYHLNYIEFNYTYHSSYPYYEVVANYDNASTFSFYISQSTTLSTLTNSQREFLLYFPYEYYISDSFDFLCLFNASGNTYVTNYSGYYTFTNPTYNNDIALYGSIIANNNLYNWIGFYSGDVYTMLYNEDTRMYIYRNGLLQIPYRYIYVNNLLIPNSIYTQMSTHGVFEYVVEPVQYTFGDMIFNVVDAPIYMLSQLFSFELFGVQFYVAFMGIVTIILIGFIVRKLI